MMQEDHDLPPRIVPGEIPAGKGLGHRLRRIRHSLTTKEGLVGDYDYKFLFMPNLPFMRPSIRAAPFFGLHDRMPLLLAGILGFQHALAMLAGLIVPPIMISNFANLVPETRQYLVSTALIVSGLLSTIQITRFRIYKTPYYIGTGLISVVGISFAIIPVAEGAIKQMYDNGFCPKAAADGSLLPCPDAYGAIIGTAAVCGLVEVLISFLPPKVMLRIFPPIVTGPTVMLIGISLIRSAFTNWAGGSGCSQGEDGPAFLRLCPDINAPHPLPWGSAEFLGLGFSVFITIILCERFGSTIMKSTSVVIGLLTGCIIAAACGYFSKSGIDSAPAVSFIWVQTFKLQIYPPIVLPIIAVFIICACEAIGDITATCDVSHLEVEGGTYESRIQGGVLADGVNGILAALMTITPMTTFAQNNGVIALTRCANRKAGYFCCFFLVVMGAFAKLAASLVAIPSPVLGGMTTFLFCSVAVSGVAIIAKGVPFNRRNRFILTAGLAIGYGATLVPTYFHGVFEPVAAGRDLQGLLNAIELIMETGFFVAAIICMILNLMLPQEIEDTEEQERAATDSERPSGVHTVTPAKEAEGAESGRGVDSDDIIPVGRATSSHVVEKTKNS